MATILVVSLPPDDAGAAARPEQAAATRSSTPDSTATAPTGDAVAQNETEHEGTKADENEVEDNDHEAADEHETEADDANEKADTDEREDDEHGKADAKRTSKARVPESTARKTALAQVPHGRVKEVELEHEGGHLIYSYDIKVAGHPGIEEVHVDARTGKVLAHEHEGRRKEAQEAKKEAHEGSSDKD